MPNQRARATGSSCQWPAAVLRFGESADELAAAIGRVCGLRAGCRRSPPFVTNGQHWFTTNDTSEYTIIGNALEKGRRKGVGSLFRRERSEMTPDPFSFLRSHAVKCGLGL
jgi:hypothetical protein